MAALLTSNELSLSQEETDHLQRSTKKVKDGALEDFEGVLETPADQLRPVSFRDKLVAGKGLEGDSANGAIDKVFFPEDDWSEDEVMDEVNFDPSIPRLKVTRERKMAIRKPWSLALIVKLLGKSLHFSSIQERLVRLWRTADEIEVVDLGQGFHVVKFNSRDDYMKVLTGGPWKILDHYLLVQRWKPNFKPSSASFGTTAVWIRLPELPIEYFAEEELLQLGRFVGKPLRIDANTRFAMRGKFARICVEIDLDKPLVSKVEVGDNIQIIEYEALHTVCFGCGIVGHRMDFCPLKQSPPANAQGGGGVQRQKRDGPVEEFGPWMLVQRRSRKIQNLKGKKSSDHEKERKYLNRFNVLAMETEDSEDSLMDRAGVVAAWSDGVREVFSQKKKESLKKSTVGSPKFQEGDINDLGQTEKDELLVGHSDNINMEVTNQQEAGSALDGRLLDGSMRVNSTHVEPTLGPEITLVKLRDPPIKPVGLLPKKTATFKAQQSRSKEVSAIPKVSMGIKRASASDGVGGTKQSSKSRIPKKTSLDKEVDLDHHLAPPEDLLLCGTSGDTTAKNSLGD
ncbi:hypothetical protein CCACVL1_14659 [Corchorus capsularis]|uniref:CCHC-type domain-containing protein n=1 Tax=Corchorus capsularis TaxID=210143 RepID=A0A1R3I6E3_COCAP|nr:hypothetical protein CCACVL1_14659 [Corchorus capsularis]